MEIRSNAVNMDLRIIAYQYSIKIVNKKKDEYIDLLYRETIRT
jgi:hypothetical protein